MTIDERLEQAIKAALVEVLENDKDAENVLRLAMPYIKKAVLNILQIRGS